MTSKKHQIGGDSSNNFQAEQMVVQVGIDEKRARELFQEMNLQLRKEYTKEALEIANERVSKFENSLMPKMEQVEGALEAFADPGFQLMVLEAQKTAASTERPADYDLLSELLMHRFQKGDNRVARAGISLAIEIVDKLSDEALLGLTVAHAVSHFYPLANDVHHGLNVLDNLFGKIQYSDLPTGQEWLDHLDILRAIRLNPYGQLRKIKQFYPETLAGFIDVGIEKNSESFTKAEEILRKHNLPQTLLIDHSFNSNFKRVPVSHRRDIDSIMLSQVLIHDGNHVSVPVKLSAEQISAVNSVYDLYSNEGNLKEKNIESFMIEWDKRSNLKALKEWWDSIPVGFSITSTGKVLAHSNAQRCDNSLPPMS